MKLSLALINARSLPNKINTLRSMFSSSSFDIIMVTETWCTESISTECISLVGFEVFRKDRPIGRGGGCLVYVKQSLDARVISHPLLDKVTDAVWLSTSLEKHELVIGCVYRPPGHNTNDLDAVIEAFNYISQLPPGPKLIAGDFNVPGINWTHLTAPQNLINFISCIRIGCWTQHVPSPTRGDNILDLVFSSGIPHLSPSVLNRFPGSDHRIVTCNFEVPHLSNKPLVKNQSFYSADWKNLPQIVRTQIWDVFFLSENPQVAANLFYDNLSTSINLINTISLNACRFKSSSFTKLNRKFLALQRAYSRTRDFSIILQLDRLSRLINSKSENRLRHQELVALKLGNQTGRLSKLLKNRNSQQESRMTYFVLPDNTSVSTPEAISDAFNVFIANSLITEPQYFQPILTSHTVNTAVLANVGFCLKEIAALLSATRLNFYPGPDGLPPAIFTLAGPDMPLLLLKLFNLSMTESVFPTQWKLSTIIPRHKKGSRLELTNYRPINHTPIISRIMERIIKRQLTHFLVSHDLISRVQHGFLKSRSCLTCQFDFLNLITKDADTGHALVVIFLDMSKAFDRVPHTRLLAKIRTYGIIDPLLSWLSSYLSMRKQVVNIDGYLSQPKPVTSGVVQGSVLGPLLFLMYINDIFHTIRHGKPFLFADDIKIVYSFPPQSLNTMLPKIQRDLESLESWCNSWLMSFSADKSSFITYRCCVPLGRIMINGSPIALAPSVNDLGLHYSGSFTFSEQATFQISKAKRTIGLLHKSFLLQGSKLILYKSHVRTQLEYCSIVFTNMNKAARVAIEGVQRVFSKQLIGFSTSLNYRQRCELLNLEPLWLRRIKLNLCFLFNMIHRNTYSSSCLSFLTPQRYHLRHSNFTLPVSRCRVKFRYNFFLLVYSRLWNKLPEGIRSCQSLTQFKLALRKFMLVPNLVRIAKYHIDVDRAYEVGLEF
ncbi:reverse transcriptase family protein [Streptococcus dysgalactiae]|uniref:reverse transcriptase family protein n=1 Tax=Streptococcus dysgalactiae TaxID=1334 RepID=UPI00194F457C|nr:reverse transcriptase family protein [Streptococcus dysgalactiae]MBM6549270.1 RNA-directed DNA polymerase [Streptococcus dysgalactiae subsp. equisimilis]